MSIFGSRRYSKRASFFAVLAFAGQFFVLSPAHAEDPQCNKRFIAQSINDAVLALKATQYCVGQELPYTQIAAYERIESLRCGPESTAMIDRLMNDNDKNYRLIMTSDPSKTVCKQAAQLSIE